MSIFVLFVFTLSNWSLFILLYSGIFVLVSSHIVLSCLDFLLLGISLGRNGRKWERMGNSGKGNGNRKGNRKGKGETSIDLAPLAHFMLTNSHITTTKYLFFYYIYTHFL